MAVSPHHPSGGASGACERAGIGSAGGRAGAASTGLRPQTATNPKANAHAMDLRMAVVSVGIGTV